MALSWQTMTSSDIPAPATAADADAETPTTASTGCEHCDGSIPHEHVDVRAAVAESGTRLRRRLTRDARLTQVLVLAGLAAHLLVDRSLGALALAVLVGATGWFLGTLVALALTSARADRRGVVLGAAALAALVAPTGAVATLATGHVGAVLSAAAAWLACAGAAQVVRTRTALRLLDRPGREGEALRQAATHGRLPGGVDLGWLGHAAGVLAWGAPAAVLPATLVVTVPLHVALTLGAAVRAQRAARLS